MQLHSMRYTVPDIYGPTNETQTIERGDRRLDPPDAGPEPGAGRRRAGFEEGRISAAGLVRRLARAVARADRRDAPGGTGKADADSAILDLAADRPAGGRGAGGAPRVQDRQARPVRRDHRGGTRAAEEDVECLFRRDREARRLEAVRFRCAETVRPARPPGLLVRRGATGRRPRRRAGPMILFSPPPSPGRSVRGWSRHRARSVEAPFIRIFYGA